jgi:uncharacterized protein (UPF0548 family)
VFFFTRPTADDIERFLHESSRLPLSYDPVGLVNRPGSSFDVDEAVTPLGSGFETFERAKAALSRWAHFELGWVEVFPPRASIEPGSVVAVLIRHFGLWSLNGCRVVYSVDNATGTEFGFAYGTLTNHAESGEEVFKVVLRQDSGEVVYVIRAASKPRAVLARLGYPAVRSLQARFRTDSARVMQQTAAGRSTS